MVKKLFLCVTIALLMVVNVSAQNAVYVNIQQVNEKMPEITTYIEILDSNGLPVDAAINKDNITAYLDGQSLVVDRVKKFADSYEGIGCLFLIDISKSISNKQLESIKAMIESWINEMNANDYTGIITFGETVNVLQEYTSSKETLSDVVSKIEITDNATKFYEGIDKGLLLSKQVDSKLPSRKIMIVISDGEDMFAGGITQEELINKVGAANTPIYGIGTHYGDITKDVQDYLDDFGALSRTSGGSYYQIGDISFEEVYNHIRDRVLSAYVIGLRHSNNHITGKEAQLNIELSINEALLKDEFTFILDENIPDTVAPEVLSFHFDKDRSSLQLEFSEPVVGADEIDSYVIKGDNDQVIIPETVVFESVDGTYMTTLHFNELEPDTYTVNIRNIIDQSMEKNPLTENNITFTIENEEEKENGEKNDWVIYAALAGSALLLVLVLMFVIVRNKKKQVMNKADEIDEVESNNELRSNKIKSSGIYSRGKKIQFNVIDTMGDLRNYDLIVVNAITIGRSEDCDLSFSDEEMSRKHFIIKYEEEVLLIKDLDSVNGTYVNGIPVNGWLKLNTNDIIMAGNIEMKINY